MRLASKQWSCETLSAGIEFIRTQGNTMDVKVEHDAALSEVDAELKAVTTMNIAMVIVTLGYSIIYVSFW
jgi:hypothetical protein